MTHPTQADAPLDEQFDTQMEVERDPCGAFMAIQALTARAEAAEAERDAMKKLGIVEVAVRNPNVMEYMKHWEGRTEAAEAKLAVAVGLTERLLTRLREVNVCLNMARLIMEDEARQDAGEVVSETNDLIAEANDALAQIRGDG